MIGSGKAIKERKRLNNEKKCICVNSMLSLWITNKLIMVLELLTHILLNQRILFIPPS